MVRRMRRGYTAGQKPGRCLMTLNNTGDSHAPDPILDGVGAPMLSLTRCSSRLLAAGAAGHAARQGRRKNHFQGRLEHLRRLDAVGLRRAERHPQEVGRQVRHQDRAHADQRLRRVDQPVHRRQVRRLRDDQHGHADDSRRGRRGFHRADRRRLLQRQRRRGAQGRGQEARRHQGSVGQPGRAVGLALPAGARPRIGRAARNATSRW